MGKQSLPGILAAVLALALWAGAAGHWPQAHLPTPLAVLAALEKAAASGELWRHLAATLGRVVVSFVLAMSLGTAVGCLLGRSPLINRLFGGWLLVLLNLPALVVIILAYIWFGLTEAAAVFAVALNKLPHVAVTVREGSRALDPALEEMAIVFQWSRWRRLRHILLPHLVPYLFAAARSGLALIWKIVLVVEMLGRSNGVGFQIHLLFQVFDVAGILAYSLAFIAVIQAVEWGVLRRWEARCVRWRG
ncbi:ABC transporter permease [Insolitispirillum peregrinum]|uniref:ABC transporter permease n=1 Tax=Insolitispirillum peregrinum TaxID=80876 RepID=UPI00361223E4